MSNITTSTIVHPVLDQDQAQSEQHQAVELELEDDWLMGWSEEQELDDDQSCNWSRAPRRRDYRRW